MLLSRVKWSVATASLNRVLILSSRHEGITQCNKVRMYEYRTMAYRSYQIS
jgi:hypothetical protein